MVNWQELKKIIRAWLRVCVHCSEYLLLESYLRSYGSSDFWSDALCSTCNKKILQFKLNGYSPGYPFRVLSLYNWYGDSDQLLRNIIIGLKGGGPTELYQKIAQDLCALRIKLGSLPRGQKIQIVPAPPRLPMAKDHAHLFAEQISNIVNADFKNILARGSAQQQKKLSLKQRKNSVKIKASTLLNGEDQIAENALIIFIDDVITTGSTAQAAFVALGRPKHFEVWTMATRPKS